MLIEIENRSSLNLLLQLGDIQRLVRPCPNLNILNNFGRFDHPPKSNKFRTRELD